MYKELSFTLTGVSPLLCHNGQLANPLNKWAKAIKAVSSKRSKTDEDFEALSHLEFLGSLYLAEDLKTPVVPGVNIESMLVEAAKKQKLGNQFKAGILSDGLWPIIYDGPKDPEELWKIESFRDIRGVKIGTSTIMRTRPIFRPWKLALKVSFETSLLNESAVADAMVTAGRVIGLCDYTPKFGRFEVE